MKHVILLTNILFSLLLLGSFAFQEVHALESKNLRHFITINQEYQIKLVTQTSEKISAFGIKLNHVTMSLYKNEKLVGEKVFESATSDLWMNYYNLKGAQGGEGCLKDIKQLVYEIDKETLRSVYGNYLNFNNKNSYKMDC